MTDVHFYFDYISPFAYLGWKWVRRRVATRDDVVLHVHPTLFAGLLKAYGHLGPAEIPPKARFVLMDAFRIARSRNIPFRPPPVHPFNPLNALRMTMPQVAGDRQLELIDALFTSAWGGRREDLTDADVLAGAVERAGLDRSLVARTQEPAVKQALREATEAAVDHGVFGVPTVRINDLLFWGNDQEEFVISALEGRDPLDLEEFARDAPAPGHHRPRPKPGEGN